MATACPLSLSPSRRPGGEVLELKSILIAALSSMTVQWPFSGPEGGRDVLEGKCRPPGEHCRQCLGPGWSTGSVCYSEGGQGHKEDPSKWEERSREEGSRERPRKQWISCLRRGRPEKKESLVLNNRSVEAWRSLLFHGPLPPTSPHSRADRCMGPQTRSGFHITTFSYWKYKEMFLKKCL